MTPEDGRAFYRSIRNESDIPNPRTFNFSEWDAELERERREAEAEERRVWNRDNGQPPREGRDR